MESKSKKEINNQMNTNVENLSIFKKKTSIESRYEN